MWGNAVISEKYGSDLYSFSYRKLLPKKIKKETKQGNTGYYISLHFSPKNRFYVKISLERTEYVITIYNTDVKQLYIPRKFEIFCEHDRREGSLRFENFRGM